MAKEVKKNIRITASMNEYISLLSKCLQISENDVFKMMIFDSMKTTRTSLIKGE